MLDWLVDHAYYQASSCIGESSSSSDSIPDLSDSSIQMSTKKQCIEIDQTDSDQELMNKSVLQVPRIRSLLASKSCRSAVMIGDVLTKPDMDEIVCKLATLNQPWNCPHGRPTIRHLFDLPS